VPLETNLVCIVITNWMSFCFCLIWCISLKVYVDHLLEPLLQTILALSGPRTTIVVCFSTPLLNYAHISYSNLYNSLVYYFVLNLFMKLGYEIRSTSVHEKMLQMWKRNFDVKTVSKSKVSYMFQWVTFIAVYMSWISYTFFSQS